MKRSILPDSLLVCCLATILIWPLFRVEYLDNWTSIESTFISDARMLDNNLPRPGWQPLWYCGTRFDYVYPPALRYGTALISKTGHISTARAYHLYTAFFYVFGIVAVYWLVRIGTASRIAALLAAAGTALLSPSFLLLPLIRNDSGFRVPQRLHVLMLYGEGPHVTALCILTAALAATLPALRNRRPAALAAAAFLCALSVANNFYGATALLILFPIMVWAVWTGERNWRVWLRAAGIAVLAWGLSAFWLTPSYLKITLVDLKWVSQPGNTWSEIVLLVTVAIFCAISFKLGKDRPDRAWTIFVTGSALVLSLDVAGYYYFGFLVAGDSPRLVPELDLALILAFVEIMRRLWVRPRWRIPAAIVVLLAFYPALLYLRHVWSPFPEVQGLENRYEYRISKWVHDNLPGERTLPSGTVRFWFDTWFDNSQLDGGSMQGMLNQNIPFATWNILKEPDVKTSMLWLRAMGTDAIIVPDQTSLEGYHDYSHPAKFRGAAPVLFDDRHGTVIYRIERSHPGIGRIVDRQAIGSIGSTPRGYDEATLAKYVSVVEDPNQPAATIEWRGFDEAEVRARTSAGDSVLLQETYDPAWHAYEGDQKVTIRPEPVMDFMLLDLPAGDHVIRMRFETPLEDRAGAVLLVISLMTMAALIVWDRRLLMGGR